MQNGDENSGVSGEDGGGQSSGSDTEFTAAEQISVPSGLSAPAVPLQTADSHVTLLEELWSKLGATAKVRLYILMRTGNFGRGKGEDCVASREKLIAITNEQCYGTESGSTRSTCFWASWIRILLLLSKNSKKNLYFYCFVTSF